MEHNFLKDKVWLITGATSGLGRALAFEALKLGAKVAAVARHERGLEEFREWGERFIFVRSDISKKESIYRIAGEVAARLGPVDILVNNASSLGPTPLRPLLDIECEEFSEVLETNLLGPFRLTKAVLPSMILRRQGTIINISSDAAIESYSKWGIYSSSKAALDHLTRVWQSEVSDVQFLAIDPGEMNTPMHEAAIPEADKNSLKNPRLVAKQIVAELSNFTGAVRRAV